MIPAVLHRIWLDDPTPPLFDRWWQQAKRLHPGWAHCDWRHSSDLPWPRLQHPTLIRGAADVFPADWRRFQADLLRLEVLYLYGGVYMDADLQPLAPWDQLLAAGCVVPWSPNRGPGGKRLLSQFLLGAEPGHPFIAACLAAVPDALETHAGKPLAQVVGPWLITRVWEAGGWDPDDVRLLPERAFGPQSIRERDNGASVNLDGCLGWHRWNNTAKQRGSGVETPA